MHICCVAARRFEKGAKCGKCDKIDIDNSPVESSLIDQLLASDDLLQLVDELYFEHHVNVAPMYDAWNTQKEKATLADTYRIFSTLRSKGVIAHSWV